jgi:hypothetical protein
MSRLLVSTSLLGASLATVLASPLALAQPGATATVATPAGPPTPSGASEDPNIDRGFLLPTAETQPAGSLTFNSYELLLAGLTYGVTDSFQVSATTLVPVAEGMPLVLTGSGKLRLLKTDRVRVALHGSLTVVAEDDDQATLGTFGGTASLCMDDACHSMLSGSLGGISVSEDTSDPFGAVYYGASIVHRVAARAKLLAELAAVAADFDEEGQEALTALNFGVRFFSANLAADLGFVVPLGEGDDELVLGIPFVNLSYRTL